MQFRIIKSYRDVIAICDSHLIGKRFEEGKFQLDIKENFYSGQELSEEKVAVMINQMAREDATFNIVGERAVEIAIREGLVLRESVKTIQGIPFAMVLA